MKGSGNRKSKSRVRHNPRLSEARWAACECLRAVRERDAFASNVIRHSIDASRMSSSDKAFATRLVYGVVATRGALDYVIDRCLSKPSDIKPDVRDALRVSAYEMLYLDKESHAAVDQGVELVRSVQSKATGVANYVLRRVAAAAESFPFGDPQTDLQALSLAEGFPPWLAARLCKDIGESDVGSFMRASNEPAPVFVSICPLKGEESTTLEMLVDMGADPKGVELAGMDIGGCYILGNSRIVADERFLNLVEEGLILVSDAAAQAVSQIAVDAAASGRGGGEATLSCLELCAGRGTKTILLQSAAVRLTGDQMAPFVAVDNVEFKVGLLAERANRYSAALTEAVCADILKPCPQIDDRIYDLVFLDAPCSGLGTLRRHPEIRWRASDEAVKEFAERDRHLIKRAAKAVSPGGVLAYSTCTIAREENSDVVDSFLASKDGEMFERIDIGGRPAIRTRLTSGGSDAHFCALLRKRG